MHTSTSTIAKLWRAPMRRGLVCGLFAALVLASALSGCQTNAQDENFKFNNPLDPNQDTGDGSGDNTGQVVISSVDALNDIVQLVNTGTENTDMSGWTLENEDNSDSYAFSGFTLNAGDFVRVRSDTGVDGTNDLYTGSALPN